MKVVGSVIARLGSKRLPYKNLLPFEGVPLVRLGVLKLLSSPVIDQVVISTESDLIAHQVKDLDVCLIKRPEDLSRDDIPSIPVFQHIMQHVGGDIHLNYNINFPNCDVAVFERAIEMASMNAIGEALSVPYAVWAQSVKCLSEYPDPWNITAERFDDDRILEPDIHELADLEHAHLLNRVNPIPWHNLDAKD